MTWKDPKHMTIFDDGYKFIHNSGEFHAVR